MMLSPIRNRRILAARRGWPDGALEACERFDAENPEWSTMWRRQGAVPNFEHPAGFLSTHLDTGQLVCGVTIEELTTATFTVRLSRYEHWRHKICCALVAEQLPKRDRS